MPADTHKLGSLTREQRDEAIAHAAGVLRDGRLVVFPTETVYGIGSLAGSGAALAAFGAATGLEPPHVWHAATPEDVLDRLDLPAPVARRLGVRLLPGPVQLNFEQPQEQIDDLCHALGIERGIIDDGLAIAVRVPDHAAARDLLRETGAPVVATRAGAWAGPGADLSAAGVEHADPPPGAVLDAGPPRLGKPSTALRIGYNGSFEIVREGAVDERTVMAALERTILFVCTGNTCRSPMAEAIARTRADASPPSGITTTVMSAGVAAVDGLPPSPEAVDAMRARGLDISGHRSRGLRRRDIDRAEIVYTMTPSHAEAVMRMAPDAAHKVFPLDPRGLVPDPIGLGSEEYERTAERLTVLIESRFKELEP